MKQSLTLARYEMIIANSVLRAPLAVYHLISNACLWNTSCCQLAFALTINCFLTLKN